MAGVATGTLALTAYHTLHPTPDVLTYVLAASLTSHLLQSYLIMPYVTKQQYLLREFIEGREGSLQERKKAAMRFGISHLISVLLAYGAIFGNFSSSIKLVLSLKKVGKIGVNF